MKPGDASIEPLLSKGEVLGLARVWWDWFRGPDPANNRPPVLRLCWASEPNALRVIIGMVLVHPFLWFLTRLGLRLGIAPLAIWGSMLRIKHDHLWLGPFPCGWNHAYTDLGLAYLKMGRIREAIECLERSWRMFPCPHNTSFGPSLWLCRRLESYAEAKEAVAEYLDMREVFMGRDTTASSG